MAEWRPFEPPHEDRAYFRARHPTYGEGLLCVVQGRDFEAGPDGKVRGVLVLPWFGQGGMAPNSSVIVRELDRAGLQTLEVADLSLWPPDQDVPGAIRAGARTGDGS